MNFCGLGDFERLAISKKLYEIADMEMNDLAKSSGGSVFPVADLSEARSAFKSVADEIGTKYTLGYYSSNDKRDGKLDKFTFRDSKICPSVSAPASPQSAASGISPMPAESKTIKQMRPNFDPIK